jgi:hypothetical protein
MAKVTCSACGSTEVVPIEYGLPGPELIEASERGEVEIGGCLIMEDDPTHRCRACGHRFRRRARPRR